MKKEDLYDINSYTDKELYEILDLDDPSDRELEAKILMMIHKYQTMNTNSGKRLALFFEGIYDHFFENDNSESIALEEFNESHETEMIETMENMNESNDTKDIVKVRNPNLSLENNTEDVKTEEPNVIYTTNLEYSKGALNPLLKQTTKRIISIDSQYRSDKTTFSTEFTFNLSEPLKDVVSLKLYSIQIPYTWYTIGKSYGSNFFYLKGSTDGINTETHDIQIEISPGNYKPQELIDTVNQSIQNKDTTIDADISNTNLVYNSYTSLSTFNLDITKNFNECSYYLNYSSWESPYQTDASRNQSIPAYLGFQTRDYYSDTLKSPLYYSLENINLTTDSNATFTIDSTNNFFTVIKYNSSFPYNAETSSIDVSQVVRLTLADGTYTRNQLITNLNTQLTTNSNFQNSYVERKNIDASNNEFTALVSYIEMGLKFDRTYYNPNVDNKTVVIFPETNNLWVGATSCFRFDASYNELNEIYSEVISISQNDRYIITNEPFVQLTCTLDGFVNILNDASFSIPDSVGEGYTISEYIDTINESIRGFDTNFNNTFGYKLFNSPEETYEFNSSTETYPIGTFAYIQENMFKMFLDINKTFDETMYEIDIENTIFKSIIILKDENGDDLTSDIIQDLTKTYTATMNAGGINILAGDVICRIQPKTDTNNGNEGDQIYELKFDADKSYTNYPALQDDINTIFSNYIDNNTNINIFSGTKLASTVQNNVYNVTFDITVLKKLITKNYSVQFIDTLNNTWENNLFLDDVMTDQIFDMSFNIPSSGATQLYNSDNENIGEINDQGRILIRAIDNIAISNTLTVETGINDTIQLIAYEDGVYSVSGSNNVTLTIPAGIYSTDYLISTINDQIAQTTSLSNITNTQFSLVERNDGNDYVKVSLDIKRNYTANDYNLVFYDRVSFSQCFVGTKSVQNTTWDTTVGWIMGFRNFTTYDISAFSNNGSINTAYGTTVTYNSTTIIEGDTGVSTSLFNYFLLCLDDYNQNHLNDGLVTITGTDTSVPLPSYAKRSEYQCDPVTGELVYNNTAGLTEKQIYAANEIANASGNTDSIGSSVSTKSYGTGPYVTDVFGLIPVKTNNLTNGAPYVEFGGTLQNQERVYFGPVNIQRMTVKLVSDRGNLVDLNNANWSFSLICEQLNKLEPNKK